MWTPLLLALSTTPAPQDPGLVARNYDLSALRVATAPSELVFSPAEIFYFADEGGRSPVFYGEDLASYESAEERTGPLFRLFESWSDASEGEMFVIDGGDGQSPLMRLVAPAAIHAEFQLALNQLIAASNSGSQLTLEIFRLPANAPTELLERGLASEQELQALRATAAPETYSIYAPRGAYGMHESGLARELIPGYHVEIASGSFIHDPMRVEFTEGLSLVTAVGPVPGGHWLNLGLRATFDATEPASREAQLPGLLGDTDTGLAVRTVSRLQVDEAEVSADAFAFDAFVPEGSALVFGARSGGDGLSGGLRIYALSIEPVGSSESRVELAAGGDRVNLIDGSAVMSAGWGGGLGASPFAAFELGARSDSLLLWRSSMGFGIADSLDAELQGSWFSVAGNPARERYAAEELQRVLDVLNAEAQRLARRAPVVVLQAVAGDSGATVWLPLGTGLTGTVLTGRFAIQQTFDDVEVATGAATADLTPFRVGQGLAATLRRSEAPGLDMLSIGAWATLAAAQQPRGVTDKAAYETELLRGAQATFEGSLARPTGPGVTRLAGAEGAPGPRIDLRVVR